MNNQWYESVYHFDVPMGQFYYSGNMLYQSNGKNCIFLKWILE